jgi:hypothetical protein
LAASSLLVLNISRPAISPLCSKSTQRLAAIFFTFLQYKYLGKCRAEMNCLQCYLHFFQMLSCHVTNSTHCEPSVQPRVFSSLAPASVRVTSASFARAHPPKPLGTRRRKDDFGGGGGGGGGKPGAKIPKQLIDFGAKTGRGGKCCCHRTRAHLGNCEVVLAKDKVPSIFG